MQKKIINDKVLNVILQLQKRNGNISRIIDKGIKSIRHSTNASFERVEKKKKNFMEVSQRLIFFFPSTSSFIHLVLTFAQYLYLLPWGWIFNDDRFQASYLYFTSVTNYLSLDDRAMQLRKINDDQEKKKKKPR